MALVSRPHRRRAALVVALTVGVTLVVALAVPAMAQDDPQTAELVRQAEDRIAEQARSYLGAEAAAGTLTTMPRLTVRPRQAATGRRTGQAGTTTLAAAGFPDYYLYVPPQCVGTARSPLVVLLHGGGGNGADELDFSRALADSVGVIVLSPTSTTPGYWDFRLAYALPEYRGEFTEHGLRVSKLPTGDLRKVDSALKVVLRTHAIDPARIALLGFSNGGSLALLLGRSNPDVFSRVAALSALIPYAGGAEAPALPTPRPQVFLSGGLEERMAYQTVKLAQVLRAEGYPVVTQLGLRPHVGRITEEAFTWRWLVDSWKDPKVTTRVGGPYLNAPADTDVVLTLEAVQQMTDFWARLLQEPDTIYDPGHMAHHPQLLVPLRLGAEPVTVTMTDIPALAAKYPSVAADLTAAGPTAAQAMAYRKALARVGLARALATPIGQHGEATPLGQQLPLAPIAPRSVLGQNLALWRAHPVEFQVLEATGFYTTP